MSDGKKAWSEECEQRAFEEQIDKVKGIPITKLVRDLDYASGELGRFITSNPSLTKNQHLQIDRALAYIDKCRGF